MKETNRLKVNPIPINPETPRTKKVKTYPMPSLSTGVEINDSKINDDFYAQILKYHASKGCN